MLDTARGCPVEAGVVPVAGRYTIAWPRLYAAIAGKGYGKLVWLAPRSRFCSPGHSAAAVRRNGRPSPWIVLSVVPVLTAGPAPRREASPRCWSHVRRKGSTEGGHSHVQET